MGRIKQHMIEQLDTDEYIDWLEEQDDEVTSPTIGRSNGHDYLVNTAVESFFANPTIAFFWERLAQLEADKARSVGDIVAGKPGPDSEPA